MIVSAQWRRRDREGDTRAPGRWLLDLPPLAWRLSLAAPLFLLRAMAAFQWVEAAAKLSSRESREFRIANFESGKTSNSAISEPPAPATAHLTRASPQGSPGQSSGRIGGRGRGAVGTPWCRFGAAMAPSCHRRRQFSRRMHQCAALRAGTQRHARPARLGAHGTRRQPCGESTGGV